MKAGEQINIDWTDMAAQQRKVVGVREPKLLVWLFGVVWQLFWLSREYGSQKEVHQPWLPIPTDDSYWNTNLQLHLTLTMSSYISLKSL